MSWIRNGDEILIERDLVKNGKEQKHYCMYRQIHATCSAGVVSIELREPTIDGTEWQGALIVENIKCGITLDGADAGTIDLVAGQGSFNFSAGAGTYEITLQAPLCQSSTIQAVIS